MPSETIKQWLRAEQRNEITAGIFWGGVSFLIGLIVFLLTFAVVFGVAKLLVLIVAPSANNPNFWSATLAVPFGVLLFVDAARADRDDMAIFPLWFLREYFLIGPRLVLTAAGRINRVRAFVKMDLNLCAEALRYLAGKSTPTSQEELRRAIPGLSWDQLREGLQLLPGVIFFRPNGVLVALVLPLRLELRALAGSPSVAFEREEPQAKPVNEPHKLSSSEILGVSTSATLAEIKAAYRHRVKECHPDHFANMDDYARKLAEEWTKALNAAYEDLLRARGEGRG